MVPDQFLAQSAIRRSCSRGILWATAVRLVDGSTSITYAIRDLEKLRDLIRKISKDTAERRRGLTRNSIEIDMLPSWLLRDYHELVDIVQTGKPVQLYNFLRPVGRKVSQAIHDARGRRVRVEGIALDANLRITPAPAEYKNAVLALIHAIGSAQAVTPAPQGSRPQLTSEQRQRLRSYREEKKATCALYLQSYEKSFRVLETQAGADAAQPKAWRRTVRTRTMKNSRNHSRLAHWELEAIGKRIRAEVGRVTATNLADTLTIMYARREYDYKLTAETLRSGKL